jgi:hypothetical protein
VFQHITLDNEGDAVETQIEVLHEGKTYKSDLFKPKWKFKEAIPYMQVYQEPCFNDVERHGKEFSFLKIRTSFTDKRDDDCWDWCRFKYQFHPLAKTKFVILKPQITTRRDGVSTTLLFDETLEEKIIEVFQKNRKYEIHFDGEVYEIERLGDLRYGGHGGDQLDFKLDKKQRKLTVDLSYRDSWHTWQFDLAKKVISRL